MVRHGPESKIKQDSLQHNASKCLNSAGQSWSQTDSMCLESICKEKVPWESPWQHHQLACTSYDQT